MKEAMKLVMGFATLRKGGTGPAGMGAVLTYYGKEHRGHLYLACCVPHTPQSLGPGFACGGEDGAGAGSGSAAGGSAAGAVLGSGAMVGCDARGSLSAGGTEPLSVGTRLMCLAAVASLWQDYQDALHAGRRKFPSIEANQSSDHSVTRF